MREILEARQILKDAYIDLVGSELSKKHKKHVKSQPLMCRVCGARSKTLRKCSDGYYICDDCLNKE